MINQDALRGDDPLLPLRQDHVAEGRGPVGGDQGVQCQNCRGRGKHTPDQRYFKSRLCNDEEQFFFGAHFRFIALFPSYFEPQKSRNRFLSVFSPSWVVSSIINQFHLSLLSSLSLSRSLSPLSLFLSSPPAFTALLITDRLKGKEVNESLAECFFFFPDCFIAGENVKVQFQEQLILFPFSVLENVFCGLSNCNR